MAGARILVTRPQTQALKLARLISERGGCARKLPLIGIEPLKDSDALAASMREAINAQWWVFTSTNAVRFAAALLPPPWGPSLAAVGPASAEALADLGCTAAVFPSVGASSEGLLELSGFAPQRGERVVILTGQEGRQTLAHQLEARGVRVETLAIYRRFPLNPDPAIVASLIEGSDVIVVTSGQILDQLLWVTPPALRPDLLRKPLAVSSPRVVEHAMAKGFMSPPLVPETVSDEAFVEMLGRWWSRR